MGRRSVDMTVLVARKAQTTPETFQESLEAPQSPRSPPSSSGAPKDSLGQLGNAPAIHQGAGAPQDSLEAAQEHTKSPSSP